MRQQNVNSIFSDTIWNTTGTIFYQSIEFLISTILIVLNILDLFEVLSNPIKVGNEICIKQCNHHWQRRITNAQRTFLDHATGLQIYSQYSIWLKVRPLFMLSHGGTGDNSPLLIVVSANQLLLLCDWKLAKRLSSS